LLKKRGRCSSSAEGAILYNTDQNAYSGWRAALGLAAGGSRRRTFDSKSLVPLWNLLRQSIRNADAIILSDYGYGTIVPDLLPRLCKEAGVSNIPIVVDSRFRMSQFHGVTSITPNITELEASTGISIGSDATLLRKVGEQVLRRQQLRSLLVTQGKFGMTLFEPHKAPLHIPIYGTDEVADVTGAGDTVIAVFALALACGAAPGHAAQLANYAGGIVVMKRGTATVSREELRGAIQKEP
jgi:rfaE bifunctional protein kinase chain/domain